MKSLNKFIGKGHILDRLRNNARLLDALVHRIRTALPPDVREHVTGCAPRPGTVVVFVDSSAWLTQLRYLQQEILGACRQVLDDRIERVQFKVMPPEPPAGKPPAPELSKTTRRLLQGAANGIADDELAAALRRLSDGDQDAD